MKYEIEQLADEVILRLQGDLDGFASDDLAYALDEAIDRTEGKLVVDLHGVGYISSVGVGAIMYAFRRLRERERSMELRRVQPDARKVLLMTGVGKLMSVDDGSMQVYDVLQSADDRNALAMVNAREFLTELLDHLGVKKAQAKTTLDEVFRVCGVAPSPEGQAPPTEIEAQLRELLSGLDLARRIEDSLAELPKILHDRVAPYLAGCRSLLHVRAGDGLLAQTFARDLDVQLLDVTDHNRTSLPLTLYDGRTLPFPNNAYDAVLLINVLSRASDPSAAMKELLRVAKRRIIVIEPVCFNDVQRRMNMFFDWLYERVLRGRDTEPAQHFDTPKGWKWFLRDQGLRDRASVDLGLELPALPEYHWLFAMDKPSA